MLQVEDVSTHVPCVRICAVTASHKYLVFTVVFSQPVEELQRNLLGCRNLWYLLRCEVSTVLSSHLITHGIMLLSNFRGTVFGHSINNRLLDGLVLLNTTIKHLTLELAFL